MFQVQIPLKLSEHKEPAGRTRLLLRKRINNSREQQQSPLSNSLCLSSRSWAFCYHYLWHKHVSFTITKQDRVTRCREAWKGTTGKGLQIQKMLLCPTVHHDFQNISPRTQRTPHFSLSTPKWSPLPPEG